MLYMFLDIDVIVVIILSSIRLERKHEDDETVIQQIPETQILYTRTYFKTANRQLSDQIQALARSIQEVGLIEPVIVRRPRDGDTLEIVSGNSRLRAMRSIGWKKIPCIVIKTGDINNEETKASLMSVHSDAFSRKLTHTEANEAMQRIAQMKRLEQGEIDRIHHKLEEERKNRANKPREATVEEILGETLID